MPNHSHDNEDKAREEVESFISGYKTRMEILYHYAVTKDGILIGHVGIGETKNDSISVYEICCGINKNHRGFGYAAEAAKAFASWCKSEFGIDKIFASTEQENIASIKTLLKAGFTLTDINIEDRIYYALDLS
jgi:RimJ/RimL family protein N-acetyltransferase